MKRFTLKTYSKIGKPTKQHFERSCESANFVQNDADDEKFIVEKNTKFFVQSTLNMFAAKKSMKKKSNSGSKINKKPAQKFVNEKIESNLHISASEPNFQNCNSNHSFCGDVNIEDEDDVMMTMHNDHNDDDDDQSQQQGQDDSWLTNEGDSDAAVTSSSPWSTASNKSAFSQMQTTDSVGPRMRLGCGPNFRVAAPQHVAVLKYRHGPVPLPALSWADERSVWNIMCWKDTVYCRNPHLLQQHPLIKSNMRAILIDWLSEVCEEFKLHRETFYLSIDFVDRFLSKEKNMPRENLQLLGVTALFLAAKLEEIYPPKRAQFAEITAESCSVDEIDKMEMHLLKVLNWALCPITAVHWVTVFLQILDDNEMVATVDNKNTSRKNLHNYFNADHQIHANFDVTQNVEHFTLHDCNFKQENSNSFNNNYHHVVHHQRTNNNNQLGGPRPRKDFVYSKYHRHNLINIAQLIDLCILDIGSLQFSYSVLAASAFTHVMSPENSGLFVSGFKMEDISACYDWMKPFARAIKERGEIDIKIFPDISEDDLHNIQTHVIDLTMLEKSHSLQQEMLTKNRMSPVFMNQRSDIFPTPPSDDRGRCRHQALKIFCDC